MAEVVLSSQAERDLDRLPQLYRAAIGVAIGQVEREPLSGKALKGEYRRLRSKRVGAYRIICEFDARKGRVLIAWIRHRGGGYR